MIRTVSNSSQSRASIRRAGKRVLMLVSSDMERDRDLEQRAVGPRRDYFELAQQLDAGIYDIGSVQRGWLGGRLTRWFGPGPTHALLAVLKAGRYDVVFSDSEHVGLFAGFFLRFRPSRPRHVVLAHHLTPSKKHIFVRLGRPGIDAFILHSEAQREFAISKLGLPPEMIQVLPYQVDTEFWKAQDAAEQDVIATAGLEYRDYETLLAAVETLPITLRIGAASNWSRKQNSLRDMTSTDKVTITAYNYDELRSVYAQSRFVVVPLLDADFQAGITTILEAMAMGKAVITTSTKGHCGAVIGPLWAAGMTQWPDQTQTVEKSTGIYVSPGDEAGLSAAMQFLFENPAIARRLGANGRREVTREFTVRQFAERFAGAILGPDHKDEDFN